MPNCIWGRRKGLSKQLAYANRQQIPLAVLVGSDEFQKGEVTTKNLKLGRTAPGKKTSGEEVAETLPHRPVCCAAGECVFARRRIVSDCSSSCRRRGAAGA